MKFIPIFKFIKHIYVEFNRGEKSIFWLAVLVNLMAGIMPSTVIFFSALIISKLSAQNYQGIYIVVSLFVFFSVLDRSMTSFSRFVSDSINDLIWRVTKINILKAIAMPYELTLFENKIKREQLSISLMFGKDLEDALNSLITLFYGLVGLIPLIIMTGLSIWWLPILVISSQLPFIYFIAKFEKLSWDTKETYATEFTHIRVIERILTQLEYAKEIRLFAMQANLIQKWVKNYQRYFNHVQKNRKNNSLNIFIISILSGMILLIPILYMTHTFIQGEIGIAAVSLVLGGILGIKDALSIVVYNYGYALEISYQINPYFALVHHNLSHEAHPTIKPELKYSLIEFKQVSFSYENSKFKSLENIDLSFEPNKSYAIVGDNGSGKSTLIKLLCGFYPNYTGQIEWHIPHKTPKIVAMFQDFAKLPLTVTDFLNSQGQSEQEVMKVLSDLNLQSLNTQLSEYLSIEMGGRDLSIGQWQKLSLARLLLHTKNADILLFDEPNAALDPETESDIIQIILELSQHKTSIIVSHRMAVAKMVDEVLVMDHGNIIEQGNHQTLMKLHGKYFEMFQSQSQWYQE